VDNGKNEPQGDYTSKKKALAADKAESVKERERGRKAIWEKRREKVEESGFIPYH